MLTTVPLTRFAHEQWIPFPLSEVFDFFANPANLPVLTEPSMDLRIDALHYVPAQADPTEPAHLSRHTRVAAGPGSKLNISFRPIPFLPLRLRWKAHIMSFAWNQFFTDEQVNGPFERFLHRHSFVAETRNGLVGTVVKDEINFALRTRLFAGLSIPRFLVEGVMIPIATMQLQSSFHSRGRRLLELLESKHPEQSCTGLQGASGNACGCRSTGD